MDCNIFRAMERLEISNQQLTVLALGDLHITLKSLKEVDIYFGKLKVFLDTNKVDIICVLGDLLDSHERLHCSCLNKALEYARLVSSYTVCYFIVGNHDMVNQSAFLDSEHWMGCMKEWKNVKIVDNVLIEVLKGNKIVFCPYVPDGKFIEALNTRKGEWEDAKCIFSHVTIRNVNMGNMIAQDADKWDETFPMLVTGHIHLPQRLQNNCYYAGSIMQVAVNESEDKSIALVKINDGNLPQIEEIKLNLPVKKILHIDSEEMENFELPKDEDDCNVSYTVYVSGSYEEFKTFRKTAKYKELSKQSKLRFIQRKIKGEEKTSISNKTKQEHFSTILYDAVNKDNDYLLSAFYSHLLQEDVEDLSESPEKFLIILSSSPTM